MSDPNPTAPEFSRPIDLSRVGSVETAHDIAATAEERAALARRFGLLGVGRLEARVRLRRTQGGTALRLSGHLDADVTQACVVTLEPVQGQIAQDFTVLYGQAPSGTDVTIDPDAESVVEPWPEGPLDIGEAVAQELVVALDPYPHAPGAALESAWRPEPGSEGPAKPFASLAKLKTQKE
ncbi:MAG TPA: DUF177 domain-containing protein [Alphaproteobacteria bacterium]